MKKLLLGVIVGLSTALLIWSFFGRSTEPTTDLGKELKRISINTTGPETISSATLPSPIGGANWGLKQGLCEQGGYDLTPYAGKMVTLTQYPTDAVYAQVNRGATSTEPLNVWIVQSDGSIACIYLAVRQGSLLIPGVFSVNDPSIVR